MASVSISIATSSATSWSRVLSLKALPPKTSPLSSLRHRSPLPYRTLLPSSSCFPSSVRFHIPFRCPNSRASIAAAMRDGLEVPAGIAPGGAVETDKLPSGVRERAMSAVDYYGGRVTLGDVSSRAGLKLNEAETALQALATDTGGFLEVSDEGDVLYVFPKDYRSKLAAKSFRMKVEPLLDKVKAATSYLIRVSFGTALIASIVLVYTTIIILLSSSESKDNRSRREGRSYNSGFSVTILPTDLFWYWDTRSYRRRQTSTKDGMNFVESVFSFVFGDGDPNQGLEEERWKLIGQYIATNGGVVAAEELAPYLDVLFTEETQDDESFILPVLLRFQGHPEIDDKGNILYRFPSLQRTASSQGVRRKEYIGTKRADWINGIQKYFEEKKWQFSKAGAQEKAMVIGLGAFNLFGVIVLKSLLKEISVTTASQGLISLVTQLFPLLQIYAASFFGIPLIRWLLLLRTNAKIEKRNKARMQRAEALELADPSLRRKMLSARDMAQRTVISSDRIVYSTDKDFSDQDYETRDWEKRFKELDQS